MTLSRLLLCIVLLVPSALAQHTRPDRVVEAPAIRPLYTPREHTVVFSIGLSGPMSHNGIQQFWNRGPQMSLQVMVSPVRAVQMGVGIDASLWTFRKGTFQIAFPQTDLQARNLYQFFVYLTSRYYFRPGLRLSHYAGFDVGISKTTPADYKVVINGVRQTYYDIPGTARLAVAFTGGVDYFIGRRMAVLGEVRVGYINNDPNLGLTLTGRAGIKYSL